jgi:hypothetical protein
MLRMVNLRLNWAIWENEEPFIVVYDNDLE